MQARLRLHNKKMKTNSVTVTEHQAKLKLITLHEI